MKGSERRSLRVFSASAIGAFSVMSWVWLKRVICRCGVFLIWTGRRTILVQGDSPRGWVRVRRRKDLGFWMAALMAVL